MDTKIFLDTGGLIALAVQEDQSHKQALRSFDEIVREGCQLFTTEYVLEELVTWFRYKSKYTIPEIFQFLHNLYIKDLNVIEVGRDRFGNALILMHKFQDQYFSMTDCVSFVVMKELKINDSFTTDKHFTIAGFNNLLEQDLWQK